MKLSKLILILILSNLLISCKITEKANYRDKNYLAIRTVAQTANTDICTKDTNLASFFIGLVNNRQLSTEDLLDKIKGCINKGADVRSRTSGITTMHLVIGYRLDTRDCTIQQERSHSECEDSSSDQNYEKTMIDMLVEAGADIDAKDTTFDSFMPLHTAVAYNYPAVKTLFDKGANPNAVDKDNVSILEYAITRFSSLNVITQILTHPEFNKNVKNSKNNQESILAMTKRLSETSFYSQYDNMVDYLKDVVRLLEEHNMP